MATLSEIREGLKDRLEAITGLRVYAYAHPKPEPPAVCVVGPRPDIDGLGGSQTFDDLWAPRFELWFYVAAGDVYRAQQALDLYLDNTGAKSVRAALRADPGLAGLAVSVRERGLAAGVALTEIAGVPLLSAALAVEVYAV